MTYTTTVRRLDYTLEERDAALMHDYEHTVLLARDQARALYRARQSRINAMARARRAAWWQVALARQQVWLSAVRSGR